MPFPPFFSKGTVGRQAGYLPYGRKGKKEEKPPFFIISKSGYSLFRDGKAPIYLSSLRGLLNVEIKIPRVRGVPWGEGRGERGGVNSYDVTG